MLKDIYNAIVGKWEPSMVRVVAEKVIPVAGDAYDIFDVISESATNGAGTAWKFINMAKKNGGGGYITTAVIQAQTTNIASWLSLFLFTKTPTCELDEDAANTAPIWADRMFYLGRIDFPACSDIGTGMSETIATPSTVGNIPIGFVCEHDTRDIYGVLAIRNAVDLADNTTLTISLIVEQI